MWVFVAEAIGALGLLLFIVWWTLGPTHRREQELLRAAAQEDAERRTAESTDVAPDEPDRPGRTRS